MLTQPYLFLSSFWDVDVGGPMPMVLETAKSYRLVASADLEECHPHLPWFVHHARCWISEVGCQPDWLGVSNAPHAFHVTSSIHVIIWWHSCPVLVLVG